MSTREILGMCKKGLSTYALVALAVVMGAVWCIGNSQYANADTSGVSRITGIDLTEGPVEGGDTITITGEGFNNSFTKLSATYYSTYCGITGLNQVYCWGHSNFGAVGGVMNSTVDTPTLINGLPDNVIDIATGHYHICALTDDGKVYCWGSGQYGELGDGWNDYHTTNTVTTPRLATELSGFDVVQVGAGSQYTCVLDSLGDIYCFGYNGSGQLGNGIDSGWSVPNPTPTKIGIPKATSISVGSNYICAVTAGRDVWCWGANYEGQLGFGSVGVSVNSPGQATGLSDIVSVHTGSNHTCAIDMSGDMYCWGSNSHGELGNGTTSASASTTKHQVQAGGAKFASVALGIYGYNSTCAKTTEGAMMCWGHDSPEGKFGLTPGGGSPVDYITPQLVTSVGSNVAQVEGNTYGICVLKDDGTVWCFGSNNFGVLGRGTGGWFITGIPGQIAYPFAFEDILTKVTLDGLECTDLEVISPTQATCVVPAHVAGKVDVTGYFSNGGSSTLALAYEYVSPAGPGDDDPVIPGTPNTGIASSDSLAGLLATAGIVLLTAIMIKRRVEI